METTTPAGQPIVSREQSVPFLIRAFVKVGGFHRLTLFEDGTLPTTDEQQIFSWKDATLREVLTALRNVAPQTPEFRHPLARYSFRAIYADSANRGRFAQKELGMVYSRDILGEPGTQNAPASRLLEDTDGEGRELTEREKEERTLEELRFVPGDYLCVAILLPKGATVSTTTEVSKAAAGTGAPTNGWRSSKTGDGGWSGSAAPSSAPVRGGGHWRGDSHAPPPSARGRGGRSGDVAGRDRDLDRRPPPPKRDSPPHRGGWGDRGRGGRGRRRTPSRSRSRSPPRRRNSRYN